MNIFFKLILSAIIAAVFITSCRGIEPGTQVLVSEENNCLPSWRNDFLFNCKKNPDCVGSNAKKSIECKDTCNFNDYIIGITCDSTKTLVCGSGTATIAVDINTDKLNCGGCNQKCDGENQKCVAGACSVLCESPSTKCGDSCVDLNTNVKNCGSCGTTCDGVDAQCVAGACFKPCKSGLKKCGDNCVDLKTNINNCGKCGHPCQDPKEEVCTNGECELSS